ncbi:hypothetical protein BGZ61DRAFT_443176 [Ilyonectria robusta]|uniref:uncharacterized protein n=1 Tax=Ilyonectria robusta TaxID=1079257 RepID=UPI001E8CA074|nr:uncharacterized protein BGZ61DRAFT_443176 [Ilyonectria robusta]KAH8734811.1 hypothetical protein BGZ61DRAFT_443176 [Ilyonectria robusta]
MSPRKRTAPTYPLRILTTQVTMTIYPIAITTQRMTIYPIATITQRRKTSTTALSQAIFPRKRAGATCPLRALSCQMRVTIYPIATLTQRTKTYTAALLQVISLLTTMQM